MLARVARPLLALAAALLFLSTPPVRAQEPAAPAAASAEGGWAVSAAAGLLIGGTVYIEPYEWDTGTGFTLNAAADYMVGPRFSIGAMLQYASTDLTELDVGVSVVGFGGTLKGHFGNRNDLHARAGIAFMYQTENVDEPGFDSAHGLGIGLVADVVKPLKPGTNLLGQIGFITQPSGGNPDAEVTWGPLFYVAIGLELAR